LTDPPAAVALNLRTAAATSASNAGAVGPGELLLATARIEPGQEFSAAGTTYQVFGEPGAVRHLAALLTVI